MLPVIPLASISTIALMGIFARHNRKAGWVKDRKPLIQRLRELKLDLSAPPRPSYTPSVWYAGMAVNPTEFSQQLGLLQTSLQRANAPELPKIPLPQTAGRAVREKVAAGS